MGVIEHSDVIENAVTLGGGGGALTPPVTIGTPGFSFLSGDTSTYPLIVSAATDATNGQNTTALYGNDAPTYNLDGLDAYTGTGNGVFAQATGASGTGVYARASGTGGTGAYGRSGDGTGVWGDSDGGGIGVKGTGSSGGTGVLAYNTAGDALAVVGRVVLFAQAAPGTPDAGSAYLYLDVADNTLKVKTSDGVVHALW